MLCSIIIRHWLSIYVNVLSPVKSPVLSCYIVMSSLKQDRRPRGWVIIKCLFQITPASVLSFSSMICFIIAKQVN